VIDLRHDENPLEMRSLVVIRPPANCSDNVPRWQGTSGLDSTSFP